MQVTRDAQALVDDGEIGELFARRDEFVVGLHQSFSPVGEKSHDERNDEVLKVLTEAELVDDTDGENSERGAAYEDDRHSLAEALARDPAHGHHVHDRWPAEGSEARGEHRQRADQYESPTFRFRIWQLQLEDDEHDRERRDRGDAGDGYGRGLIGDDLPDRKPHRPDVGGHSDEQEAIRHRAAVPATVERGGDRCHCVRLLRVGGRVRRGGVRLLFERPQQTLEPPLAGDPRACGGGIIVPTRPAVLGDRTHERRSGGHEAEGHRHEATVRRAGGSQ